ncbi:MAG: molybdopterin-binding protein [Rhodobacteraceae bacterium]|nr:molybdopterin-binding protein [Paracoccaceae bacterium]
MEFGPVPPARAEGAILAHSLTLPDGRLRKGKALKSEDISRLQAAGIDEVTVARLGPEDLGEDAAATAIAAALVPDPAAAHLRLTPASTGRVNLMALGPGVVEIDVEKVEALNRVDPMITLATLPPFGRVTERTMLATVKIISYGVARSAVEAACKAARDAIRVRPVRMSSASLIMTDIGEGPGKGEDAIGNRLKTLGIDLSEVTVTPHRTAPLAKAVSAAKGELILILTASATSDIRDVAPEAVRHAGGEVTRFGMPVDPGNLLFIGALGNRSVIGLPGCARSPALNGADWVLERVVTGVPVGDAEIAAMGVGGLLKDIPIRGLPRSRTGG